METLLLAALLVVVLLSTVHNWLMVNRNARYVTFMVAYMKFQVSSRDDIDRSMQNELLDLLDDVL